MDPQSAHKTLVDMVVSRWSSVLDIETGSWLVNQLTKMEHFHFTNGEQQRMTPNVKLGPQLANIYTCMCTYDQENTCIPHTCKENNPEN